MEIINVSKAMLAIMKQIKPIRKDGKNPYFKSGYATLNSVLQEIMKAVHENGCICQTATYDTKVEGTIGIEVRLIHVESGEMLTSQLVMPMSKSDPQAAGSAISYARRYALIAFFNLEQVDDDAELAMGRRGGQIAYEPMDESMRPKQLIKRGSEEEFKQARRKDKASLLKQLFFVLGAEYLDFTSAEQLKFIQEKSGKPELTSTDELTEEEIEKLITSARRSYAARHKNDN